MSIYPSVKLLAFLWKTQVTKPTIFAIVNNNKQKNVPFDIERYQTVHFLLSVENFGCMLCISLWKTKLP